MKLLPVSMPITGIPQTLKERLQKQTRSEFRGRSQSEVRQDRNAPLRERAASAQAFRVTQVTRTRRSSNNSDRAKKHSTTRKTVPALGWVERPVSLEVDQIAFESGQTRSHTIATLLKEAVHQRLHIQHAVMLSPLVRKAVVKGIQGLLPFLISIAYDSHQTRHLTGNVLAKNVPPNDLERIRVKTEKLARHNILHQRPEIEDLVEVAKQWFADLEREEVADPE
jgi:hypothetical protein